MLCVVALDVGAFSHATESLSSASRGSRVSSPQSAAASDTAFARAEDASFESSQGYSPASTAQRLDFAPFLPFFSNANSSSAFCTTRGMSASRTFRRAMNSAFPPRRMSVPRPAMLVEMVTAARRPLWATISASRSTFSGLAFSSSYGMPSSLRSSAICSERSTEVVPTSVGRPSWCMRLISVRTAFHLPFSERKTTSWLSSRSTGRLVGTTWTERS
mmetsp:Transcript_11367/g.39525  ORF Transcript_11367/g.39525 Transcript_11367/m.39525 type:complete len:217 (-) Transcript_11367:1293-1943(-)